MGERPLVIRSQPCQNAGLLCIPMALRLTAIIGAASALALLLQQPAGAESIKDQIIRRKCEAKVREELVSKGMVNPPPQFAEKVCNCVVQKVNAGSTLDAAKETCKAEVQARIEGAAGAASPAP